MPIEAVIFDIGDVLECNPPTGWPERWAQRLGLTSVSFEHLLDDIWTPGTWGGTSLEEIELRTAEALDLDQPALEALMEDVWAEYVGTLNRELADYFSSLRPRYKTGILSNSFVGAREREEEAHGLGGLCDVIVYSHEEGCLKPDPRIYGVICSRLGVAPRAAVLVDDVQENIDGADAVGMHGIRFRDTAQAIEDLEYFLLSHQR